MVYDQSNLWQTQLFQKNSFSGRVGEDTGNLFVQKIQNMR